MAHLPAAALPRATATLTALLLALAGSLGLASPAHAAELVVTITADGVSPEVVTVVAGDAVTFVNDDASPHRAVSTSPNWTFDSGLLGLLPGARYTIPDGQVGDPGTYTYGVADGASFQGSVVLPAPAPASPAPSSPAPSPPAPASPTPGGTPAATPGPGSTSAVPTRPSAGPSVPPARGATGGPSAAGGPAGPTAEGGTGAAALPPLTGGSGSAAPPLLPRGGGAVPLPVLAGQLPVLADAPTGVTAAGPTSPDATPQALAGDLPGGTTARRYGLPAALAAVLVLGTGSLLVRLLLAEPASRPAAPSGPVAHAAVD